MAVILQTLREDPVRHWQREIALGMVSICTGPARHSTSWLPPSVPLRPQPRVCSGLSCPCWSSCSSSTWWQALLLPFSLIFVESKSWRSSYRPARDELPPRVGADHWGDQFLNSVLLQADQQGQRRPPNLPRLTYLTPTFCDKYITLLVKSRSFPDLPVCMDASRQLEVLLIQ